MAKLAKLISRDEILNRVQDQHIQAINPLLANPIVQGNLLRSVALAAGSNSVDHGLGRTLVGWYITRQRSAAAITDLQDANSMQDLTLALSSSAAVTVDIAVF